MYESFFGLTKLPFKITPDPEFIYWNKDHRRAASIIAFGIEQTVPITVVTGDIGTGKTTLIQQFLDDAPTDTTVGLISNFWSGMGGLYQWILNAFDIDAGGSEVEQFRRFQDYVISEYAAGRRCILIVDEAQNVSDPDLEQLRMLTNINSGKDSLLMLFLVGQQQLRDRLMEPQNRQIAQRVGAAFHLGPMTPEDTAKYVRHRIKVAGGTREIFDDGALARIHEIAGGVPRMINVVCELALVTAFGDGVETIDAAYVDEFLSEAQANGMIAHLPLLPDPDPAPQPAPAPRPQVPDTPPSAPVSLRAPARSRQRQQRIRLVTEQEERATEMRADTEPPTRQDAPDPDTPEVRATEDSADAPLAREKPETEEAARTDRDDAGPQTEDADDRAAEGEAPEAAAEEPAADPAIAAIPPDLESHPTVQEEDVPPRRWRGRAAAVLDNGLDAALVVLAVLAIHAATFGAPDAPTPDVNAAGTPQDETTASTAAAAAPPVPARPSAAPQPIIALDNPTGEALMERALTSGAADPRQAAIDYARAALRGEARAAYYLGQLFETGDGVNRDIALARAWYGLAADSVRSARRRMADLPVPEQGIVLAPPVPLLGGPMEDGSADFVWTGGKGADPALYVLELAGSDAPPPRRLAPQRLSAQRVDDIGDAARWRVIAADPALGLYSVSGWRPMGAADASAIPQAGASEPTLAPRITLHLPDTADASLETRMQEAFPAASIATAPARGPASLAGVEYAYEADAPVAQAVAAMIGDGLSARRAVPRAPDADPPLPGEIAVIPPLP